MASVMHGVYQGEKRVELEHELSGSKFFTDAPPDNNGLGRAFSPTDLVGAAFGSCVLTVMSIGAEKLGIELPAMNFTVEKEMQAQPRRVSRLSLVVHLPAALSEDERKKLENIGNNCPVHKSLHPDVDAPVEYIYDL